MRMVAARPWVYLAGDGARILGADGAEAAGRLAALACWPTWASPRSQPEVAGTARASWDDGPLPPRPVQAFPGRTQAAAALPDGAVVCRCETITAGELRRRERDGRRARSTAPRPSAGSAWAAARAATAATRPPRSWRTPPAFRSRRSAACADKARSSPSPMSAIEPPEVRNEQQATGRPTS